MIALAVAVAIAVGLCWAVSPVGTAAMLGLSAACAVMTASLPDHERARVRGILAVAVVLRMALIAGVFLMTPADRQAFAIVPDSRYLIDRSIWLRNLWAGVPLGPHQYSEIFFPFGSAPFVTFLAALQMAVGPAPFGLSFVSAAACVTGALVAYLVVRRGFGTAPAQVGLVVLLFWPSLVAWSISVLKEPAQLLLTSIVCAGAVGVVWSRGRARVLVAGAVIASLALLASLRSGSMEIALAGLGVAAVLRVIVWRRWLLAVLIVMAVAGAWTARNRIAAEVRNSASRHVGHVKSAGVSYRLLDDRYYSDEGASVASMSFIDDVRFLAAAAIAFVAVPLPWQAGSAGTLALLPQQIAWYLICAAAVVGGGVGMRRAPWLTCVLMGSALAGLLIIAPNSGNVGTLMRHRDLIVPFVIWLAGLGAVGAAEAARGAGVPLADVRRS